MANFVKRGQRDFQVFENANEFIEFLKDKFQNIKFYVVNAPEKTEVSINEYLEDNSILLVMDELYEPSKNFSLYGLADKYIEIDLELLETRGPGYFLCGIKAARKALQGRKRLRLKLDEGEVFATNFRVSTHHLNVTDYNIPTTIKVLLDQFKSESLDMADIVDVNVFKSNESDPILANIKKTGKSLLISDTSDPESYKALNNHFVGADVVYGSNLKAFIKLNIEKGYKSIIISPLIDVSETGTSRPFGYVRLIYKSTQSDIDLVYDLKEKNSKLIEKIRDANTKFFAIRQNIVDISRDGARIKITDGELKALILQTDHCVFDILFKLSAPITISGDIISTRKVKNDLYVGIDFKGNSSRKDEMKRLYNILDPIEIAYKVNLLKNIKEKE